MKSENKKPSKLKKILKWTLLGILSVVLILVIVVAVIAGRNMKAMNRCVDAAMAELRSHYTVTPRGSRRIRGSDSVWPDEIRCRAI